MHAIVGGCERQKSSCFASMRAICQSVLPNMPDSSDQSPPCLRCSKSCVPFQVSPSVFTASLHRCRDKLSSGCAINTSLQPRDQSDRLRASRVGTSRVEWVRVLQLPLASPPLTSVATNYHWREPLTRRHYYLVGLSSCPSSFSCLCFSCLSSVSSACGKNRTIAMMSTIWTKNLRKTKTWS